MPAGAPRSDGVSGDADTEQPTPVLTVGFRAAGWEHEKT
jgi:hypothetical protein